MKIDFPQTWPETPAAAIALQTQLSAQVIAADRLGPVHTVAGVDVGFEQNGTVTRAAVVVL
ncbi:MAG: endonuclease V, partial [Cyanobacteria bacterium J06629_9]